jgi:hypothetical protein
MKTLAQIQDQINTLYINQFKDYSGGLNLSVPLIPRITQSYLINRTIVLGQETNTWYRNDVSDGLKTLFLQNTNKVEQICLVERYDKFIREEAEFYWGKFWDFNRLLYIKKKLKGNLVNADGLNHCWLNIFTIEACVDKADDNGRPTKNSELARKIINLQSNLLYKILEVIKPKFIIAVTGNTLDHILFSTVLNTQIYEMTSLDPNGILNEKHLCKIKILEKNHPLKNTRIIRAYHPTYFMGKINCYKALSQKLKNKRLYCSVAEYYTNTFFDAI